MVQTTTAGVSNFFPEIQVTDLPYILPNDRVVEKVYDGWFSEKLKEAALKKVPALRLMGVANTGGWRCFTNKNTQIRTPNDLKGLKLRAIESELHINLMKAMGATGTPIPWPELYTALSTGVVEGLNNGITDVVSVKFQEICKHITLDCHMYMGAFMWINNNFWKSLPEDLKKVVLDGKYQLKLVSRGYEARKALDAYEIFKKAGGTIYVPTPEEKAQFVEAAKPVRQWFIDKYGKEWVELLEKAVA